MGSGSGATLGGITLGLDKAMRAGAVLDPRSTSIVGIECTRPMFEQLEDFGFEALRRLNEVSRGVLPSQPVSIETPEWQYLSPGQLTLVYSGTAKAVQALEFAPENTDGLTVVTANYSWHRIPTVVKDSLVKTILGKSKNTVFIIADLVQNASVVNRRYFNFRDNGLLNCGNVNLDFVLDTNRVEHIELNETTAPAAMDPNLARKIGQGTTSDSIFRIGYKGDLAKSLVQAW